MAKGFDAIGYWELRHAELRGDHRNVGNRGLTSDQNAYLIATKATRVARHLGTLGHQPEARVLDAGCGAGAFTRLMAEAGFDMLGVDCSETAIADALTHGIAEYHVGQLKDFRLGERFPYILCLDVMFHIVDDIDWRASLANLAAHLAPGGRLIVIEYFEDYEKKSAAHVRWRNLEAYVQLARDNALSLLDVQTFHYPGENQLKHMLTLEAAP